MDDFKKIIALDLYKYLLPYVIHRDDIEKVGKKFTVFRSKTGERLKILNGDLLTWDMLKLNNVHESELPPFESLFKKANPRFRAWVLGD
jgi:hypothetical protein